MNLPEVEHNQRAVSKVFSAQRPFPVDVRLSALVARLRRPEPPPHQAT